MTEDERLLWKKARTLHDADARSETGLFLIEGQREIDLAVKHKIEIIHIFSGENTSKKDLDRISYGGKIVAVAKKKEAKLRDFTPPDDPLIVVLDCIEKPGNIGAIIRTAEAAGVSAVMVCGGTDDLTNPNTIRASLGAVFCMPTYKAAPEEAWRWLSERNISVITASPDARLSYYDYKFPHAAAIVIGSEAEGVSEFWMTKAGASVSIPMVGEVNSLNASVSAAILIYGAVSQRKS